MTRLVALALALTIASCAHRRGAPADAVAAFGDALARKDYDAAYALMGASYRRQVPPAEFRRRMEAHAAEVASDARALRDGARRWGERVEVPVSADERIAVVREGGAWRLEEQPLDPYGQRTPRAALRAFVRAIENGRYDVLVRLAPSRYRAALSPEKLRAFWEGDAAAENRALARELRLALGGRILEDGDEAFMMYGAGRQVRLVREEGLWRIDTPE